MLIFFRIFQGAGSAMIFATGIAILTSVYPPAERGKALGISVASVYVGLSCAPLIGGWLTQHFTWRSIFIVIVPIGIFVILLVMSKLKGEWADSKGETFDLTGSFIYGIAIIAIIYGISKLPSVLSIALVVIGIVSMVVFVKLEMRRQYPVFEVKLFKTNRIFAFSSLAALIHYSSTYGSTFLMSLYLQYIKGLSPQAAGMILIFQPVMMAAIAPISGRLSDRIEPRVLSTLGMACTAFGLALLIFIGSNTALLYIIVPLTILGFGFALFSSPNVNAIMSSVEKRHYGIASGSMGTMRLVGQMLSMAIVTLIFSLLIGKVQISPEYYPALLKSVKAAYIIFACLCTAGIYFSFSRGKLRPGDSG
jgi:MFS family permease